MQPQVRGDMFLRRQRLLSGAHRLHCLQNTDAEQTEHAAGEDAGHGPDHQAAAGGERQGAARAVRGVADAPSEQRLDPLLVPVAGPGHAEGGQLGSRVTQRRRPHAGSDGVVTGDRGARLSQIHQLKTGHNWWNGTTEIHSRVAEIYTTSAQYWCFTKISVGDRLLLSKTSFQHLTAISLARLSNYPKRSEQVLFADHDKTAELRLTVALEFHRLHHGLHVHSAHCTAKVSHSARLGEAGTPPPANGNEQVSPERTGLNVILLPRSNPRAVAHQRIPVL